MGEHLLFIKKLQGKNRFPTKTLKVKMIPYF